MNRLKDIAPRILVVFSVALFLGSTGIAVYELSEAQTELASVRDEFQRTRRDLLAAQKRKQQLADEVKALSRERATLQATYDALRSGSEEIAMRLEQRGIQPQYVKDAVDALRALIAQGPGPKRSGEQSLPPWFADQLRAYVAESRAHPEPLVVLAGKDPSAAIAIASGLLDRAKRLPHRDDLEVAERISEQAAMVAEGPILMQAVELRANARLTLGLETAEPKKSEYFRLALRDFTQVAEQDRRSLRGFEAYKNAVRCLQLLNKDSEPVIAFACDKARIEGLPHRANTCAGILWEDSGTKLKAGDRVRARKHACEAARLFDVSTYPTSDKRRSQLENAKKGAQERCEKL